MNETSMLAGKLAIFRINYKSDFILTLESDAGWETPFCIKFWTGAPSQAYYAGWDGTTYTNCAPVEGDPSKLQVQFDNHHLPIGELKYQVGYHFTVADFPTTVEDEVINQDTVVIVNNGRDEKVLLDFNGETAPDIQFALPAYVNEAQRIANEQQRIANEQTRIANEQQRIAQETARVEEFASLKRETESAAQNANDAATLANAKAQLAAEKAALAQDAATLANDKAALAQQKAEYAQQQGDYAKAQGDKAAADHQTAVADHQTAAADHQTAAADHTQAGNDHTRAESDHTRAESDHAAVELFVDSLGAFDISAYHATGGVLTKYANLSAALDSNNGGGVPQSLQKGGMSVKFVCSSDNKYVQLRYMSSSTAVADFTNEANWQGVDYEPVAGSENLVKSSGLTNAYGYYESKTATATQGESFNNYFSNVNLKTGQKVRIIAKGYSGIISGDELQVKVNNLSGTQIGSVYVGKGAVVFELSVDVPTLFVGRHSSGVAGSGDITIELTVLGSITDRQIAESSLYDRNGYFVCSTGADNSNKSVDAPYFRLELGGSIKIKFEHATNTSSVKLNINGTGLKTVYYNGRPATLNNTWSDNEVVEVYYDGENYYADTLANIGKELSANMGYFVCSTAANNTNKGINDKRFNLIIGGCFKVKFENVVGNSVVEANLVFNNTVEYNKPLYYEGARASRSNSWEAGEVVEVYYDGEKYNAYKVGIRNELKQYADDEAINSWTSTATVVSAQTLSKNTVVKIKKGQAFSINLTGDIDTIDLSVIYYTKNSNNVELFRTYKGFTTANLIAPEDINNILLYAYSTYVTGSGTIGIDIHLEESSYDDINYIGVLPLTDEIDSNQSVTLAFNRTIKMGELFAVKYEDTYNALKDKPVYIRYIPTGSSSAAVLYKLENSKTTTPLLKAPQDLTSVQIFVKYTDDGITGFDNGNVRGILYSKSSNDILYPYIYINGDILNNGSIISIENPYWSKSWQGSYLTNLYSEVKAIFVKFDNITIYTGKNSRVVKTWSDVKTDLPSMHFTLADDMTPDCLLLTYNGENSYSQVLAYDVTHDKFVAKEDTLTLADGNHILLAYGRKGMGCGEICRQYDNIKENNKLVYLEQANTKYLDTIRTKELDLLDAKDNFVFGFCSDVHYGLSIWGDQYPNVTNAMMKELDEYICLDAIINGGDNILYGTPYKQHGMNALKKEFELVNLDKFLPCVGNHDFNGVGDDTTAQDKSWTITDKDLETLYFRRCKTTYRPDGKLYYYRDFEEKKVRIIVLNSHDVPVEFDNEDKIVYDPLLLFGFRQQQVDFLVDALKLTGKSDSGQWKILIVFHVGLYYSTEGMHSNGWFINRDAIKGILSAFMNKISYSYSYIDDGTPVFSQPSTEHTGMFTISGTADFTNCQGKLVGVFNGHTHENEYVGSDGFNNIVIQSSYPRYSTDPAHLVYWPNMLPRTLDEFSIDVVILDDEQQKIVIKKFGQGSDREYPYIPNVS